MKDYYIKAHDELFRTLEREPTELEIQIYAERLYSDYVEGIYEKYADRADFDSYWKE